MVLRKQQENLSRATAQAIFTLQLCPVTEEALGREDYSAFFVSCIKDIRTRPIIQRSPRGKEVDHLLKFLESEPHHVSDIAVYSCFTSSEKYKLPSSQMGSLWTSFHKLRNGDDVKHLWHMFVSSLEATTFNESELALQLLLDAILKRMLSNKADAKTRCQPTQIANLTIREKSAIRYMSGYVAFSLWKKYRKSPKSEKQG